jgi:hypothetical protein
MLETAFVIYSRPVLEDAVHSSVLCVGGGRGRVQRVSSSCPRARALVGVLSVTRRVARALRLCLSRLSDHRSTLVPLLSPKGAPAYVALAQILAGSCLTHTTRQGQRRRGAGGEVSVLSVKVGATTPHPGRWTPQHRPHRVFARGGD